MLDKFYFIHFTNSPKGEAKLPSVPEMWKDISAKEAAMAKHFVKSQRHTIQVDYIKFMDELAELVGCKPDICKYFGGPKIEQNF